MKNSTIILGLITIVVTSCRVPLSKSSSRLNEAGLEATQFDLDILVDSKSETVSYQEKGDVPFIMEIKPIILSEKKSHANMSGGEAGLEIATNVSFEKFHAIVKKGDGKGNDLPIDCIGDSAPLTNFGTVRFTCDAAIRDENSKDSPKPEGDKTPDSSKKPESIKKPDADPQISASGSCSCNAYDYDSASQKASNREIVPHIYDAPAGGSCASLSDKIYASGKKILKDCKDIANSNSGNQNLNQTQSKVCSCNEKKLSLIGISSSTGDNTKVEQAVAASAACSSLNYQTSRPDYVFVSCTDKGAAVAQSCLCKTTDITKSENRLNQPFDSAGDCSLLNGTTPSSPNIRLSECRAAQ